MRTRFTLLLLPFAFATQAQVACDILAPVGMEASFEHTWAEPQAGSWATPDMVLVANRVIGELALAVDGSASDSLCCEPLINGAAVSGKIAVVYRATCDYSLKAKNCQDAGALAVIIINNVVGAAPAVMGAGDLGTEVTIPVFQIRASDGATLRTALDAGTTITALLGNKDGYYASDVGFNKLGILMPPSLAHPSMLAANAGEYNIQVAAWVHNFGSDARTGVTLNASIDHLGSPLYDESSFPFDLAPGDSVFITLPDFTQPSFNGRYTLTYSTTAVDADQHLLDNTFSVPFEFDDVYSFAPLDATTGIPVSTIGIQPATPTGEYESCVHFRDAHASRMAVSGIHRYASINAPLTLDGELVFTRVYQWMDNFTGLSDPNFTITTLGQLHYQKHILEVTTNQTQVFLPFDEPIVLEDNVRYLICTATVNPNVFFGYNENVHYATNQQVYDQPDYPNRSGTSWFIGFTGGPVSSLGVKMIDANTIGFDEHTVGSLAAYPNPSAGLFHVSLAQVGPATITVTDASGRVLRTDRASDERYTLDLRGEAPGVYLLMVESTKGRTVGRLVIE